MAQKSRQSRSSLGGRQKANVHHEEKRQAKFAEKRANGTAYKYEKNPYDKTSDYKNWNAEAITRAEKNVDRKLPLARWTSIMAKLDNSIAKAAFEEKKKESKKGKKGD